MTAKVPTKTRLILAAERLIGDAGVDGVSMRQISEASGNRNIAAAQYHFGSLHALIQAVMAYRKTTLDHLRERFYREMNMDFSHMSVTEFVSLIVRPHMSMTNEDGERTFARFLKSIQQDAGYYDLWQRHYREAPFAHAIYAGLRKTLAHLPEPLWQFRLLAIGKLIPNLIVDHDATPPDTGLPPETFVAEVIGMVTSALSAPPAGEPGHAAPAATNGRVRAAATAPR